jgi:hypothetical protein
MQWTVGTALAVVVTVFVPAVQAQDVPIDVAVVGDAVPGAAVTVTLTTTDGSAIQGVAWEQVYGVAATLSGDNPLTVTLGPTAEYKAHLFDVLVEPPVGADSLPPYVPPIEGEFTGGLQNQFTIVGLNPYQLEEAGLVVLDATVATSSGTYDVEAEILTALPGRLRRHQQRPGRPQRAAARQDPGHLRLDLDRADRLGRDPGRGQHPEPRVHAGHDGHLHRPGHRPRGR